jgi:hypothetical protein
MRAAALTAILALAPLGAAQDRPSAQSFFPNEYASELLVDFARLRALEVWDGLRTPVLAPLMLGLQQHYGFSCDDVDELRGTFAWPTDGPGDPSWMLVMTGTDRIRLPDLVEFGTNAEDIEIGGRTVRAVRYFDEREPDRLFWSPANGMLVEGSPQPLAPVLEGKHRGGVRAPELLRHTADPGHLAYFATGLHAAMRRALPEPFGDWLVEDDPLTFAMVRLRVAGDADDPTLVLEALLQCERGPAGPERLQSKIEGSLKMLQQHPRLGAHKRLWKKISVTREHREVLVALPLGRPRQAAGLLAELLMPLALLLALAPAEVEAVAAPAPVRRDADKR